MLPGNMGMAEGYLRMFKLILEHRCLLDDEVAGAHEERFAPHLQELMQETDALERRTTSALILEGMHAIVENLTSSRHRRHGRWLMGIWTSRLQREVGGVVLDYRDERSLEEMRCVRYVYVPLALEGDRGGLPKCDTPAGGLPSADDCDKVAEDARWVSDWCRTWPPFEPPDTWQWN